MKHVKNCFGCSPDNPSGLKVKFKIENGALLGEFHSSHNHEGPPSIVHGGVIAAIIDESFAAFAVQILGTDARTVRAEIAFRRPAYLKDKLHIQTTLKEENRRLITLQARVYVDSTLIAEGRGTLFKAKTE